MGKPNRPSWHKQGKRYRCYVAGKPVYFPKTIGEFDKPLLDGVPQAAWIWLDNWKKEQAKQAVDTANPTVNALVELYLQWAKKEQLAGRMTLSNYSPVRSHLRKFKTFVPSHGKPYGERLASEIDDADLKVFAEKTAEDGSSKHYVANLCKSVKACWNWGARKFKDSDRPIQEDTLKSYCPPKPPKSTTKYIEQAHLNSFLRWAWKRARRSVGWQRRFDLIFVRMLWFLALTGARPGEACGARWKDVRWRENVISLEEWKNGKKTGKIRDIHLTPPVARILRRIERLEGHHQEWIFTHALGKRQSAYAESSEGTPWNTTALDQKIRKWRQAAAKEWRQAKEDGREVSELEAVADGAEKFVVYLLRHTYITDALHAGYSESEIAELAGTSAQMIAETYGHIQRKHSSKIAHKIAEHRRQNRDQEEQP